MALHTLQQCSKLHIFRLLLLLPLPALLPFPAIALTHAAHFSCVLNCICGMVAEQLGHLLLHPLHRRCSQRFEFKWRASLASTFSFGSNSSNNLNSKFLPHEQQSYILLGLNIALCRMTRQSLSPLVSRLACSIRRRTRRKSALSFRSAVGSAEAMSMHCSRRYAMDCRRSLAVFLISFRFSTMISDCSLIIRIASTKSGSLNPSSWLLSNSSMNSE